MVMSIWTREELLTQISAAKKALLAAATGESYSVDGRSLTRQKIESLKNHLTYLQAELAALDGKGTLGIFPMRPRR